MDLKPHRDVYTDAAFAVAIQADGKIVAADSDARGSQDFALARYVP